MHHQSRHTHTHTYIYPSVKNEVVTKIKITGLSSLSSYYFKMKLFTITLPITYAQSEGKKTDDDNDGLWKKLDLTKP